MKKSFLISLPVPVPSCLIVSSVDVMKLAKCAKNTYYKCKNQLKLKEAVGQRDVG